MCRKYFEKWRDALTKPKETFRKEKKNANLSEAAKNMGIASLIFGIINTAFAVLGFYGKLTFTSYAAVSYTVNILISLILFFFISSGFFYIVAKLLGGKGNYKIQTYLLSLFEAPLLILANLLLIVPLFGRIAVIILQVYSLYLATLALKETHNYSTGKAVATWLLPAIIYAITIIIAIYVYYFPPEGTLILPPP